MSVNKLLNELSEEELLAIASGVKVEITKTQASEASKFIYAMNIREGRDAISAQLVFYTYKQWKGFESKHQARRHFFKDFNTHFTPYRATDGMHYKLDARSFDTSIETFFIMRADLKGRRTR